MTNQVSQIMSWVRLVVLLKVWDGERHVQVPDVLNWHHLVELLWLRQQGKTKTFLLLNTQNW